MLTPATSSYQSFPDLITVNNLSHSSSSIASDTCSSTSEKHHYHRTRSIPKARPSKLSRTSLNHHSRNHHHHRRPSKQFVATTSGAIFGDWDIELKVSHRSSAMTKGTGGRAAVINGRGTPARGGGGGSAGAAAAGGGSIAIGSGPGIEIVSSGIQSLSTFPSSAPAPSSSAAADTQSPTLKIQKSSLALAPSTDSPENNTATTKTTTTTAVTTKTTKTIPPKSTAPWKTEGQSTKKMFALTTTTKPTTTKTSSFPVTKEQKKKQAIEEAAAAANSPGSPSARSSFLKALGKFKNKHLQHKRSSAPPSSLTPVIDIDIPESSADRRASYIIPPIQFGDPESEPGKLTVPAPVPEISVHRTMSHPEEPIGDGSSSLRVKFKNRVNNTIASIKSSSNLREKFKAQQAQESHEPSSSSLLTRRLSAIVTHTTSDVTPQHQRQQDTTESEDGNKNRNSKAFWTFPRVRPESNQSSRPHVSWGADSSVTFDDPKCKSTQDTDMRSPESVSAEDDCSTLHQQLQELKVEEADSDNSLDIILPVDYEDYTQFAELPLKKRKKMERSLAAASALTRQGSNKRPNSMRVSAEAVKRFLKHESTKSNVSNVSNVSTVSKDGDESLETQSREIGAINGNKKRPQLSTESDNSSKRSGLQTSEWRRSIMRSLHLGKGQQGSGKIGDTESNLNRAQSPTAQGTVTETLKSQPSTTPEAATRPARTNTTRSRSLSNATHPALLAASIVKPRSPGLRRETLEMAMRRRRQSSAARSNISDTEVPPPLPLSSEFFNYDNISTTNITHTFTSFTLELAEMYAQDVMNNSVVPGLFNFKRRSPRLTVSSNVMELDTDQEFRAFDSDGDAISGYTGDADVSMDEINVGSPKWPATPKLTSAHLNSRVREPSFAVTSPTRRKISSIDGDSDTVPELPTLTIRTRDLNRSSGGRGSGGGHTSPRSPRRAGGSSPMTLRSANRGMLGSPTSPTGPSSPTKSTRTPMSIEEIASWKPKNVSPQTARPQIPLLDTKLLKPSSRGSGISTSTTLVPPSSRAPYSQMTQSPVVMSPGSDEDDPFTTRQHYHQQSTSSSSSRYPQHLHQISGDTLVSSHPRYISTASTLSAGSGYHQYHHHQAPTTGLTEAQEFDPRQEFPPTTPADLKEMDFEALLATAEQEQQKGWEDLMVQKRATASTPIVAPIPSRVATTVMSTKSSSFQRQPQQQQQQQQQQPEVPPLRIASSSKNNRSTGQYQQRGSLAFDLGPSDDGGTGTGTGTGTGSDRSTRTKRVMKKKMSVIRLTGNGNANVQVQGRREDDGVIRVSLSPTPYSSSNLPPTSEYASARW